jgi:hypothetical protein
MKRFSPWNFFAFFATFCRKFDAQRLISHSPAKCTCARSRGLASSTLDWSMQNVHHDMHEDHTEH